MEMGYYTTTAGEQWPAQPFAIGELLRRMGYGERMIADGHKPTWWRGTELLRKIVAWKVAVRRMQAQVDFGNRNAWAGPLVALAVEEMGHRLSRSPESIADRDMVDLVVRLTKIFKDSAPSGGPAMPTAPANGGSGPRFRLTRETIELLPEGPAREKAIRDLDSILVQARSAIAAPSEAAE
jgi:hypothetical protein